MAAYVLKVFNHGTALPCEVVSLAQASQVLETIPVLLGRHRGCHRIRAYLDDALLFSVDSNGDEARD